MHATAGEIHSDGTKFNKVGLGPKCKKACLKILNRSMNGRMQQQQTNEKEKKEEKKRGWAVGVGKSENYEKKIV